MDNWTLCDCVCDVFFLSYLHWFLCLFMLVPDCLGYCNFLKKNIFLFISSSRPFEQWPLNIFTLPPNFSHHQVQLVLPMYWCVCVTFPGAHPWSCPWTGLLSRQSSIAKSSWVLYYFCFVRWSLSTQPRLALTSGYTWLSLGLCLEPTKTQAAGHSCKEFFF